MAHPKHQSLRQRYQYSCGYCSVSEIDAGGELTVDHYQPVSAGGDDSDDNLVYACSRCNLYKADVYPTASDLAQGYRILHLLLEAVTLHIRINEQTDLLEALSPTGGFHIAVLQLNRPALIEQRKRKRRIELTARQLQSVQAEVAKLQSENAAQGSYITLIEKLHGLFRKNTR